MVGIVLLLVLLGLTVLFISVLVRGTYNLTMWAERARRLAAERTRRAILDRQRLALAEECFVAGEVTPLVTVACWKCGENVVLRDVTMPGKKGATRDPRALAPLGQEGWETIEGRWHCARCSEVVRAYLAEKFE